MRAVIQRVSEASVSIGGNIKSQINKGFLVLVGFEEADTHEDIQWMCAKIAKLRVFSDSEGLMNLSIDQVNGQILVVSQFTLHASTVKGNRPSFFKAAKPDTSVPLYNQFVLQLEKETQQTIATGEFGADMQVALINDGPVTIIIDSKNKE